MGVEITEAASRFGFRVVARQALRDELVDAALEVNWDIATGLKGWQGG